MFKIIDGLAPGYFSKLLPGRVSARTNQIRTFHSQKNIFVTHSFHQLYVNGIYYFDLPGNMITYMTLKGNLIKQNLNVMSCTTMVKETLLVSIPEWSWLQDLEVSWILISSEQALSNRHHAHVDQIQRTAITFSFSVVNMFY